MATTVAVVVVVEDLRAAPLRRQRRRARRARARATSAATATPAAEAPKRAEAPAARAAAAAASIVRNRHLVGGWPARHLDSAPRARAGGMAAPVAQLVGIGIGVGVGVGKCAESRVAECFGSRQKPRAPRAPRATRAPRAVAQPPQAHGDHGQAAARHGHRHERRNDLAAICLERLFAT